MRMKPAIYVALCGISLALVTSSAFGQVLYSENFDDGLAVNRWTANPGKGFNSTFVVVPMDTNFDKLPFTGVDGVNDDFSGFAFDYSTVGIPSAPNSTGGSTKGMKLQASLFSNALGGFSVSPNGLNLTGDYILECDAWSNTLGPFPTGGSGSTNLSSFGILTSGTVSNTVSSGDGIWFNYTGDGGSSADYRAYSAEKLSSYKIDPDPDYNPLIDNDATYFFGSRNNTDADYVTLFGSTKTAPQAQIDIFTPLGQDQTGTLNAGSAGFAWNHVTISKIGDVVTWSVNGTPLIEIRDINNMAVATGGGNISFGHGDINFTSSTDPDAEALLFTLIDNVKVSVVAPTENADFNGDTSVNGQDFLIWQRGFGTPDAQLADGDANGDGAVNAADLTIWSNQYNPPMAIGAVPEPTTLVTLLGGLVCAMCGRRR
jgi:hypothetical protein